jgi:hypothetical protein
MHRNIVRASQAIRGAIVFRETISGETWEKIG